MTHQHDPEREDDLRALFEATREDADRMQLVKLRARAADVPSRARQSRRWLAFVPALALALGAAAVYFASSGTRQSTQGPSPSVAAQTEPGTTAPSIAPAPAPTAVAQDSAEPNERIAPNGEADDSEPVALGGLEDPSNDDPLAALDEPADDDVDTWLNATSSFLEGG